MIRYFGFAGGGSARLERLVRDQEVAGSNPAPPTNFPDKGKLVVYLRGRSEAISRAGRTSADHINVKCPTPKCRPDTLLFM